MHRIELAGLEGGSRVLSEEEVETFVAGLDGTVAFPGDEIYTEATSIWNGMIERRPAMVVRARTVNDVVRTVTMTRENGVELSIRGGGHNIAGLALTNGGLTLDLSTMTTVQVDVAARRAKVEAGCTLGDVDRATQEHGLAATLGFVSATGVAGLTLGGGFGYLTRQFGWTVDDLVEVELVTASGELLRASRSEHPELFWGLRGGGGNFGVVTEFVFDLHQIGPQVTAGLIAWSAEVAEDALELYREVTAAAPRQLTIAALMRNAPLAPWLPEDKHGKPMIAFVVTHTGTEAEASSDLAPVRSFGEPWADLIQVKDYAAQQAMLDATQPQGMHYYWKSEFVPGLTDGFLSTYRTQFVDQVAPANQIVLFHLEGTLGERAEDDGAVGNRDAAYACVVQSMFPGGSPSAEENKQWVRSAWQALKPFSTGGNYINFQTDDESGERIAESYRDNLDRLARIKAKYDPNNLFRVNRNIRPVS
ncbi:MAG TPA: FAD-binding oxidoreductase, partial [Acidimicrobiia bacterium]|nr:FAD-binding oxidoreductase [Acidimicrobiia bacterium]